MDQVANCHKGQMKFKIWLTLNQPDRKPPEDWPTKGRLVFDQVDFSYAQSGQIMFEFTAALLSGF